MNEVIIELKGVGFAYDGRPVLQDISFQVPRGEFLAISGPNGAGKTTLLRLIGRLRAPGSGEVYLAGRPGQDLTPSQSARLVGLVPQEFSVSYPFRAGEVVLMGRHPHLGGAWSWEGEKDLAAARRAMALTDCRDLVDKYFHELSSGEKQRVVIAAALAQQPQVILLDEPTSNLDLQHQVLVYQLLKRLQQREGLTVIAVSHDLNLAALYAEKILLLKAGRLVKLAPTAEVLKKDILEKVFETSLLVGPRPRSRGVFVLPDPQARRKK